jgi:hypothetical protein
MTMPLPPATTMAELRTLADQTGPAQVRYALELAELLDSVGAVDMPTGTGEPHAIYVGPPGDTTCLFRGRLNIRRNKIKLVKLNAYEIALERTIDEHRGEKRNRATGKGDYVIKWVAE